MSANQGEYEDSPDDPAYLIATLAIADQITNALPFGMPMGWRPVTYRAVLAAILRDAVEHSTQRLEQDDVENLSRFVLNAARSAGTASMEHRDAAYEVILGALLQDWVENWSSADEGEDQPLASQRD